MHYGNKLRIRRTLIFFKSCQADGFWAKIHRNNIFIHNLESFNEYMYNIFCNHSPGWVQYLKLCKLEMYFYFVFVKCRYLWVYAINFIIYVMTNGRMRAAYSRFFRDLWNWSHSLSTISASTCKETSPLPWWYEMKWTQDQGGSHSGRNISQSKQSINKGSSYGQINGTGKKKIYCTKYEPG